MKKNYKTIIIIACLIIFLVISLIFTSTTVKCVLEFNDLFISRLFPVSFIFITISSLLIEYNFVYYLQRVIKINSIYFYVFIMSLISGFPNGALIISDLIKNNTIDSDTGSDILMYSHFPNPLFIINSVSIVINKRYSIFILLSIIISNFIIFLFIHKKNINIILNPSKSKSFSYVLSNTIYKTFKTLILIYSISLIFYIISYFVSYLFTDNIYIYSFINGLFDLTKGCFSVSIINSNFIKGAYILFFTCFGSLSIHFQIKSILMDTSISYSKYIFGRIISFVIALTIFNLFHIFLLY